MAIKRYGCHPTICDRETLMTEDDIFMNKDLIRDECDCIYKSTCLAIIDLLSNHKLEEAMNLMDTINKF